MIDNNRGIKFPLAFYAGGVRMSEGEEHIKESVIQIIGTARGEYLLKPDFGSNLYKRIFDTTNVMGLVKIDIRDALLKYEPRIKLVSVDANLVKSGEGLVGIIIGFIIKGRAELQKLSFNLRT